MSRRDEILQEMGLAPVWRLRTAAGQPAAVLEDVAVQKPTVPAGDSPVAGMDWPQLRAKVAGCTDCKLRAGCTQTVFGVGDEQAQWMLVGEAPGAVNIGIPTVDAGPDVSKLEGDSGTVDFVFPVTLSEAPLSPVTVAYATQDITAASPGDYTPVSGTLTFLPSGGLTQYVTVQVQGDELAEANETLRLRLSDIVGGLEGRLESIGTILNDDVELSVEDTGTGITPEFLPYIFDRFRQADASLTRTHGGLGLGLWFVRQIVEAHGGTVHAESAGLGKGAIVRVRLQSL